MKVSVVYALPHRQDLVVLDVDEGTSAIEAVKMSGLLQRHPEIDLSKNKIGIYGKLVKPDAPLREGDRVEIYRPLPPKVRDPYRRQKKA